MSLKDELIFNLTVPATLQAYMCTRKPILGMLNGEGAQIIEDSNCGFVVNAGNYEGLSRIILELYHLNPYERNILSENGLEYYKRNFTLDKCIDNLELILKSSLCKK